MDHFLPDADKCVDIQKDGEEKQILTWRGGKNLPPAIKVLLLASTELLVLLGRNRLLPLKCSVADSAEDRPKTLDELP